MKWHNTQLDKLPKDKQEVLISSQGINHIAIYDATNKSFKIQEKAKKKSFKVDEPQLYWTEYTRPGSK